MSREYQAKNNRGKQHMKNVPTIRCLGSYNAKDPFSDILRLTQKGYLVSLKIKKVITASAGIVSPIFMPMMRYIRLNSTRDDSDY